MGQDPGQIREEIEATRERMSQTADALAYKADVRARAKESATAKKDALLGRMRSAAPANRDQALEQARAAQGLVIKRAREVKENPQQARDQALDTARRAAAAVRANPQPAAIAGALTVLLGLRRVRRSRRAARALKTARTT